MLVGSDLQRGTAESLRRVYEESGDDAMAECILQQNDGHIKHNIFEGNNDVGAVNFANV